MNLGEITFDESYIYEKPKRNYWRGISVQLNGIDMLQIAYQENFGWDHIKTLSVTPSGSGVIPGHLFIKGETVMLFDYKDQENPNSELGGTRFKLEDKEKAKARAIEIIQKYFKLFQEQ